MNDISSIKRAVNIIEDNNIPYALLHTTNIYPTPNKLVRLGAMRELADTFPKVPIGLSDHTLTNHACFGAIALGASILERHFTDTLSRKGPDISCSMDFHAAKELVEGSKILKSQRGGKKEVIKEESTVIEFAYSSIVSIAEIKKGDEFTYQNIQGNNQNTQIIDLWQPPTATEYSQNYETSNNEPFSRLKKNTFRKRRRNLSVDELLLRRQNIKKRCQRKWSHKNGRLAKEKDSIGQTLIPFQNYFQN